MSGKAKFVFGTYIAAALVVLSVCCAIGYSRLTDYRQASSLRNKELSFETTVKAVDSMGSALKEPVRNRRRYVLQSLRPGLCSASAAEAAALLSLPFATRELENLAGFLNLAGDLAYSLAPWCRRRDLLRSSRSRWKFSQQAGDFAALLGRQLQMDLSQQPCAAGQS